MRYETILTRAEKRLFNLHSKVREAPFLSEQRKILEKFIAPLPVRQENLLASKMSGHRLILAEVQRKRHDKGRTDSILAGGS